MVLGKYQGRYIYDSLLWSWYCALRWTNTCFQWTDTCGPTAVVVLSFAIGKHIQSCGFHNNALWRLLVDVGHVTRECIVIEATTSV
jgi:hypothetical protein